MAFLRRWIKRLLFIAWDISENNRTIFSEVKERILANPPDGDINIAFVNALYEEAWEIVAMPEVPEP
jgi:hypothetical protein